jgi:hypothetical protein
MPRQSTRETYAPDFYRPLHTVNLPEVGDIVIYNGKCRFLKADRKPRARITIVFTNTSPPNYQVKLLTNGALLFCDLADLVPIDGGYNHYRRFRVVE